MGQLTGAQSGPCSRSLFFLLIQSYSWHPISTGQGRRLCSVLPDTCCTPFRTDPQLTALTPHTRHSHTHTHTCLNLITRHHQPHLTMTTTTMDHPLNRYDDEHNVCLFFKFFGVCPQVGTFRHLSIADTPCYRDSLLYSISGALSVGLIQFMLTSESRK